jgi:diadenosine tetraphosphate (Ap4A) HIT family hydrolase
MECWTCKSNTGEKESLPALTTIFEGKYWLVEHAYPVKTIGWLVIVLKRHAEGLHELTTEEFAELAQIQDKLIRFLYEELHCEMEYIFCYA